MNIPCKTKIILILLLIAFGVISRFLPHASNFTPITAIVLFASAYLGVRYSLLGLLGIMLLSDIFIGFYHWEIMLAVYGSFALSALIGSYIRTQNAKTVIVSSLSSSLLFFLITNWAVWQFGAMYERSLSGLIQSYIMALPFFKNSLAGDIIYTSVLFGAMYAIRAYSVRKALAPRVICNHNGLVRY